MKKILSLCLCVFLLLGVLFVPTYAQTQETTVFVNVSRYGDLQTGKGDTLMVHAPVTLQGKTAYTLDDVFAALHDAYFEGGKASGYATDSGKNGPYITKFWSDTSGKFGYQVNGGAEAVMGLGHEAEHGDVIDVCIYQSYYPDTESYTTFEQSKVRTYGGETVTLTLKAVGYDENWNTVFSPCEGATILIDGQETAYVTDGEGQVTLPMDTVGTFVVSAKKTKVVKEAVVAAITAPVCVVEVQDPALLLMHNIAEKCAQDGVVNDGNMPWFVADMAMYEKLYPEGAKLSETEKKACLDKLIADAAQTTSASALSKDIIALRALGYDPRQVTTATFEQLNMVEKLTAMVDEKSAQVTNTYTLPFVMMALQQGADYASNEQMEFLLASALSQKESWQSTAWGTDGIGMMLPALSPYYKSNAKVKTAVDEAIAILKNAQTENGAISNASSTGLAMVAFSAFDVESRQVKKAEYDLVDGLLTFATEEKDGFNPTSNSFGTEQGFRGLLAWQLLLTEPDSAFYDFSDNPENPAQATWAKNCPVTFTIVPTDADIAIEGIRAVAPKMFDLAAGNYTYTVSKDGYISKTGTIAVTEEEDGKHIDKNLTVSLQSNGYQGSGRNSIQIQLKVMTHDKNICNNALSYKENAEAFKSLVSETVTLNAGQTVFDALDAALEKAGVDYIEGSYGYISEIDGLEEFEHGSLSGWMFLVNGNYVNTGCRETKLYSNGSVTWFFTDDYTKEKGSEEFASSGTVGGGGGSLPMGGISQSTVKTEIEDDKDQTEEEQIAPVFDQSTFTDVKETDWFYDSVEYVYENNLMAGTEKGFEPETVMTRAMLVTVLYRMDGEQKKEETAAFLDVEKGAWYEEAVQWAVANQITTGVSETAFDPDGEVTREQMALFFYRYATFKGYSTEKRATLAEFADKDSISAWALEAMQWANAEGLINGVDERTISPQGAATRAQVATILTRFCTLLTQ